MLIDRTFLIRGICPSVQDDNALVNAYENLEYPQNEKFDDLVISWSGVGQCLKKNNVIVFLYGEFLCEKKLTLNKLLDIYHANKTSGIESILSGSADEIFLFIFDFNCNTSYSWRDKQGLASAYYINNENSFLFSNRLNILRKSLSHVSMNHEQVFRQINTRFQPDKNVLLNGIRQIVAGEVVQIVNYEQIETRKYWKLSNINPKSNSIDEYADKVDIALDEYFSILAKRFDTVCVPLSGGVDSSLLLAKATQHFEKCIAATPYFELGQNPELDQAKKFASHLSVEHLLVPVYDDEVFDRFKSICIKMERLPRHISSIAFEKLIESMENIAPLIIYGEAADSLYGSGTIKRICDRTQKVGKLKRFGITPLVGNLLGLLPIQKLKQMKWLSNLEIIDILQMEQRVDMNEEMSRVFSVSNVNNHLFDFDEKYEAKKIKIVNATYKNVWEMARNYIFDVSIIDQFESMSRLISKEDVFISAPFMDSNILEVSYELSDQAFFGGKFVKEVLRKLGERYYPAEYMYRPKWGFATPQKDWVQNIILKEFQNVDFYKWKKSHKLGDIIPIDEIPKDDYEIAFGLISLIVLANNFDVLLEPYH